MLGPMHLAELTPPEQRVLGCLIEKRWTTPDQYPLSLNGLRLACNQSTNRDPVTAYDETTVRDAAQRLCLYGLARLASGQGSRAVKYRHLAEEALGLDREELAVLAVLLLRGPQTPGELKARTERIARLESLAEVERVLTALSERDYARRIERRPGQKEDRFEHLLGARGDGEVSAPAPARTQVAPAPTGVAAAPSGVAPAPTDLAPAPSGVAPQPRLARTYPQTPPSPSAVSAPQRVDVDGALTERITALEAEVASLRADLDELRDLLTTPAAD
jgi:uncharacterized protein YceH (UPF0502 family)